MFISHITAILGLYLLHSSILALTRPFWALFRRSFLVDAIADLKPELYKPYIVALIITSPLLKFVRTAIAVIFPISFWTFRRALPDP